MSCHPAARPGTSQKILCAKHCYEGSADDRIKQLELENAALRKQNVDQRERLYQYSNINWWLNRGDTRQAMATQHGYLMGKIQRQRAALLRLQSSRKWVPDMIIYEQELPGDNAGTTLINEAA